MKHESVIKLQNKMKICFNTIKEKPEHKLKFTVLYFISIFVYFLIECIYIAISIKCQVLKKYLKLL